jgi:hypothetical protein
MSLPDEIVFLFDCDNTRLDNDRVQGRSLRTHLASEFGLSASTGRSCKCGPCTIGSSIA